MPAFPLAAVADQDLQRLCQVLWNWNLCVDCTKSVVLCNLPSCPGQRFPRLGCFFKYYKNATATYGTYLTGNETGQLKDHGDLLEIMSTLRRLPDMTREELRLMFTTKNTRPTSLADQDQAIDLAVGIMLMVDCSSTRVSFIAVEHGASRIPWRDNVSLVSFVDGAFPKSSPAYSTADDSLLSTIEASLTAYQLKKRCGLRFEATNDLRSHLKIVGNVVKIFHHTAYLKEQLRLSKATMQASSTTNTLETTIHPRQLLLEVLDSIQLLLFRRADAKSFAMLRSLVSRSDFDADCLNFESASLRGPQEPENNYQYFGSRLADLCAELENPKPQGVLEKWLEQKSGARYVMMATLIGVVVAILLGMASLAVAIYQAWLGYQAWQHPVG